MSKYFTDRKLPSTRLTIIMVLILALIGVVLSVSVSDSLSLIDVLLGLILVAYIIPILVVWRIVVIVSEYVRGPGKYDNNQAVRTIRQELNNTHLSSIADEDLLSIIKLINSDETKRKSLSLHFGANLELDYDKLLNRVNNEVTKITLDDLELILKAESKYLKSINALH